MHRPNAGSSECATSSSTTCTTVGHDRGSSLFEARYDARSMAGKTSSLATYPVNTHSKPYVNGAQNAHVSTGAVAIAPAGRTQARALVLVPTKLNELRAFYLSSRTTKRQISSTVLKPPVSKPPVEIDTNGST